MKSFTRRLTQQQLGFKLGEECEVYGRVDELKILRESVDRDELKCMVVAAPDYLQNVMHLQDTKYTL